MRMLRNQNLKTRNLLKISSYRSRLMNCRLKTTNCRTNLTPKILILSIKWRCWGVKKIKWKKYWTKRTKRIKNFSKFSQVKKRMSLQVNLKFLPLNRVRRFLNRIMIRLRNSITFTGWKKKSFILNMNRNLKINKPLTRKLFQNNFLGLNH